MKDSEKIKIIITGADYLTGLGMARALAGSNFYIVGICLRHSSCCSSKYWDELIYVDNFDDIISRFEHMGRQYSKKAVLFASSDDVVKRISDQRHRLEPYYSFILPEKKIVNCFLDKSVFHQWAMKNGFRVPASYVCKSSAELEKCFGHIPFPIIVKPFEKTRRWDAASPLHKTFYLQNEDQLKSIPFDLFTISSSILVQQYISGGDKNVYFCLAYYDRNGKKVADYTGRKLFQWPPLSGSTAAAVGSDNLEISRIAHGIFTRAGFKGLGSIEFKKSDYDGQYYIIEPTIGRNDLQSGIAVAGGINLAAVALAELTGLKGPVLKNRKAVWIHEEGLLDTLKAYYRQGNLEVGDLIKIANTRMAFALLSVSDPLPGIMFLKNRLMRKIRTSLVQRDNRN